MDYRQLPARERTRENLIPAEIFFLLIRHSGLELRAGAGLFFTSPGIVRRLLFGRRYPFDNHKAGGSGIAGFREGRAAEQSPGGIGGT